MTTENATHVRTDATSRTADPHLRPFRIDISQADVDDLAERLDRTRWTRQLPGDGRGVSVQRLHDLADHWRHDFDWRAQEHELNRFPQFTVGIDGLDVHVLHVRSPEPHARALILTHGWPNSFVEFADTIDRLADPRSYDADPAHAFHVVVPSVPGFGFSEPPRSTGMSTVRVAAMWAELMALLGYERYGAQGGDLGAYVAAELARVDPEHVVGVHVDAGLGFPTDADVPTMTDDERAEYALIQQWSGMGVAHHALLRAAPQTFAYGWHDSPVALLAWMAQKFQDFTPTGEPFDDYIDRDRFLANVSLYWFTRTAATSSWPMYDTAEFSWPQGQTVVPTGLYGGGSPLIRRLAHRDNTIVHWPEDNPGHHHFIAMDEPEAHAADIRAFFSLLD